MRRRWLGLFLGTLLLATAPGCRVVAGAAVLAGEAVIEAAIDGAFDDDDSCDAPRRERRSGPRRVPAEDPCR